MEVKTKFNIGETVWYYGTDGLKNFKIDSITIAVLSKTEYSVKYSNAFVNGQGITVSKNENEVFESKEALISKL